MERIGGSQLIGTSAVVTGTRIGDIRSPLIYQLTQLLPSERLGSAVPYLTCLTGLDLVRRVTRRVRACSVERGATDDRAGVRPDVESRRSSRRVKNAIISRSSGKDGFGCLSNLDDEVREMSRGRKKREWTVTMTRFFGVEDKVDLAVGTPMEAARWQAEVFLGCGVRQKLKIKVRIEGATGRLFTSNLLACRAYR